MVFIETPTFTRTVTEMLTDDEYRSLQVDLTQNPETGDVVPGGGGIRKVRVGTSGKGKRGGGRIIYYWQKSRDRIFMLVAFKKSRLTNLDPHQMALLKVHVKELERNG